MSDRQRINQLEKRLEDLQRMREDQSSTAKKPSHLATLPVNLSPRRRGDDLHARLEQLSNRQMQENVARSIRNATNSMLTSNRSEQAIQKASPMKRDFVDASLSNITSNEARIVSIHACEATTKDNALTKKPSLQ